LATGREGRVCVHYQEQARNRAERNTGKIGFTQFPYHRTSDSGCSGGNVKPRWNPINKVKLGKGSRKLVNEKELEPKKGTRPSILLPHHGELRKGSSR